MAPPSSNSGYPRATTSVAALAAALGDENMAPCPPVEAAPGPRQNVAGGRLGGGAGAAARRGRVLGDITNVLTLQQPAAPQQRPRHVMRHEPEMVDRQVRRVTDEVYEEAAFNVAFEGDAQDTQRISEYAPEVHAHLLHEEVFFMPRADYMSGQADINYKMRGILVDWLVEVHMRYKLRPETLFLAINLIDRFLSVRTMMRRKLQLLGVVCMFIATKFEEIDPPKVGEFAYITDNTYTRNEILSMECTVLVALHFQIAIPMQTHFKDRLLRANGGDLVHRYLTEYLLELGLVDIRSIRHPPSLLVAAAIMFANELMGQRPTWSAAMAHHARRPASALSGCVEEFRALLDAAPRASLQAVRRKYQSDQYCAVASMEFNLRPRE